MSKIQESCNIPVRSINIAAIKNSKPSKFFVEGQSDTYLVSINDMRDEHLKSVREMATTKGYRIYSKGPRYDCSPYCECFDWKKHQLPCKHMLAVMKKFNITFDDFPDRYRNSPFFKTDFDSFDRRASICDNNHLKNGQKVDNGEEIISNENHIVTDQDLQGVNNEEETINEKVVYSDLVKKTFPKKTALKSCRYLLKQIMDHTYTVRNNEVLEDVEAQLEKILDVLKKNSPSDCGFLFNSSYGGATKTEITSGRKNIKEDQPKQKTEYKEKDNRKEKKATTNKFENINKFAKLPQPRKRKSKFSGRVGRSAEKKKFFGSISITTKAPPKVEIEEELVAVEDDAVYDLPFEDNKEDNIIKIEEYEKDIQVEPPPPKKCCNENSSKASIANNSDTEVSITKCVKPNTSKKRKTRKLKFSEHEKNIIMKNLMLTDESIDLAQQYLKKQFPLFNGLHDIALSEQYGLDVVKRDHPYIQILHTGAVYMCV